MKTNRDEEIAKEAGEKKGEDIKGGFCIP